MKKYICLLLTLTIVLSITKFSAFAYEDTEIENKYESEEVENMVTLYDEYITDANIENSIEITGIGTGEGDYDHEKTVFLKNFTTYYFSQLTANFGENYVGTCSYVATAMLLSYYDTYWDDNIIPEIYDKPTDTFYINKSLAENIESPGIKHEGDSELKGKKYEDVIKDSSNTFFHLELLRLGTTVLGMG